MSLFFVVHRYKALLAVALEQEPAPNSTLAAAERASAFVEKIRKISDLCQASMAASAQKQEDSANKTQTLAPVY